MSETNELEALLRRWAELEPHRCSWGLPPSGTHVSVQRGGIWRTVLDNHGKEYHRIQPAVQEAGLARGWSLLMDINNDKCYAHFVAKFGGLGGGRYAKDPAEAVLSAYIGAIESETP